MPPSEAELTDDVPLFPVRELLDRRELSLRSHWNSAHRGMLLGPPRAMVEEPTSSRLRLALAVAKVGRRAGAHSEVVLPGPHNTTAGGGEE
jgi:hypothetical protein